MSPDSATPVLVNQALRIVDDAWDELRGSLVIQQHLGLPIVRLPDLSLAEAQRRSRVGHSLLSRIDALDGSGLPADLALTLRVVRFHARTWSRQADWYWFVIDPLGLGLFGMFLPTAYCGGYMLNVVHGALADFTFASANDADRYLALVADYERLIDQGIERTAEQGARGLLVPKAQVHQVRALIRALRRAACGVIRVAPARLPANVGADFLRELDERISHGIEPAFERLSCVFSDHYLAKAPDTVGLGQYEGGAQVYSELVKLHTTLDLTPTEVHERGLRRMVEIEGAMHGIRRELGFQGEGTAFLAHLRDDARWRADTVTGVIRVFQGYVDRLNEHFADYFPPPPKAPFRVAPLPEALQGSMTFGYYDEPRRDRPEGLYLFNAANLTQQSLFNIGALTYHELMPGHHLQIAGQQENEALHPFRAHSSVNAYNEGWAEYAATFVGEIGLYTHPEERYGRLVMDAFLTCRLVVDTGMNVLGWSLEEGRLYMREHSGMTEAEIQTETLRYSCDIPGQSLAYKLGDTHIMRLRKRAQEALGPDFTLEEFHSVILAPGALPLPELERHVESWIAERSRAS
ncbi:MAG: DUF885 domain-containing protein [Steroidobacteraceae bacterium]